MTKIPKYINNSGDPVSYAEYLTCLSNYHNKCPYGMTANTIYGINDNIHYFTINTGDMYCKDCKYYKKMTTDYVYCNFNTLKDKIDYFKDLLS